MRSINFYLTELEFKLEEIKEEYGIIIAFWCFMVLCFFFDAIIKVLH